MGFTSKATSLVLLTGSISAAAASSWPTSTTSSSASSTSSSSAWGTDPWTAWPAPTDPSTSTTSYLATITPCPWCPSSVAPPVQNVTAQLQTLSTCSAATSACYKGKCHTNYPYSSWQWVSTTIPCSFNNFDEKATTESGSSCLVTKTEDCVPVSEFTTTVTSYTMTTYTTTTYTTITTPAAAVSSPAWGAYSSSTSAVATTVSEVIEIIASPVPVYEYIETDYCAVFSGLGPLAMLGHYDGSGLCTTCGVKGVGLTQAVSATQCHTGYGYSTTSCATYTETWVSQPAPPATLTATHTWSSQFYTSGSWDVTFTGIVPAQTISGADGWTTSDPTPIPWSFHGSCSDGPSTVTFATTVSTTVTVSVPWATHTAPYSGGGWGDWSATTSNTATSSTTGLPTKGSSSDGPWTSSTTGSTTTTPTGSTTYPTGSTSGGPWTSPTTGGTTTPTGSTTTTSSTTSWTGTPTGYVQVADAAMKYRKRDSKYIGFSGEDGIVVTGKADAASFVFEGGYLSSDGEYITCDGTGYGTFEKSSGKPSSGSWSVNGGSYGALSCKSVDFCESGLGSLFIEYNSHPSFTCPQVWLAFVPQSGPTSSPVWPSSTPTNTWSSTSSPTPDPSSDPDSPNGPWSTPKAKLRRGRAIHKAHHYLG